MAELKGYSSIVGHRDTISMLKKIVSKEKIPHAYVFQGEQGVGKTKTAMLFAAALLCSHEEKDGVKLSGEPCMECISCIKAMSGNHPDIIMLRREKPDVIGVDDIRKQIIDTVQIKPFESKYKIYIIPDASSMTIQAQNALLKTLEEPPEYVIIILIASNVDTLLPTVMSRSMLIRFNPVNEHLIKEYLVNEMNVPEKLANIYAAISMGKTGVAIQLVESEEFREKINESVYFLSKFKLMSSMERMEHQRKFAADKKEIFDYLDIFTIWFRDVLLYKATMEADSIIFKEEISAIKEWANKSSYEGIQNIINAIDKARTRLKANVNPELVLELVFLTMLENRT